MTVFKRYEGWDINLKVKIKDSLNIKVFLWIFSALVLCCLIIYGSILFFLPRSYEMILSTHIESEIGNLSETLVNTKFEDAENVIEDFVKRIKLIVLFKKTGEINKMVVTIK